MDSLDGTKDIMWSCIEASNQKDRPNYDSHYDYAFCADYWRFNDRRYAPYVPKYIKFNFTHKLARLKFQLNAGADDESIEDREQWDYTNAARVKVRSISITNAPDTVKLVIADRNNKEKQGTLSFSPKRTKEYFLKEYREDKPDSVLLGTYPSLDKANHPEATSIGQGILVPVLTEGEPYKMRIGIECDGDYYISKEIELATTNPLTEGMSYTLDIIIYNPKTSKNSVSWTKVNEDQFYNLIDPAILSPKELEELKRQQEEEKKKKNNQNNP